MTITRVADRYTLDHEVGRGACGAVWAANDEVLRRPVAIKRVGPPPGSADTEAARAEREARLAAQVAHPHVISVFDLVHDDDNHWLVMEYVDGRPLSATIAERGPLPADEVAALMAPVADALAFAHELGIVHRDVKPGNILVRRDGQAKLTDFGIARALQDATVTQTGVVTGSPAYLAPEVASGAHATPASDVWSFGATVFHALTGTPPYHRDDDDNGVLAVLYRIATEDPPRLPDSGPLGRLLELTMTPDPARRLTMAEVRDFLAAHTGIGTAGAGGAAGASRGAHAPRDAYPARTAVLPAVDPAVPAVAHVERGADVSTVAWSPARERRRAAVAAAALAGLLVLVAGGAFLLASGPDRRPVPAADAAGPRTTAASTATGAPTPAGPTTDQLEAFAQDYVRTAQRDPDAGFRLLTRDYQRRSPDYAEFWGSMRDPRILDITADPEAMTVTYDYRYELPGSGTRTERVTLELVQRADRLLIADAH